MVGIGLNEADSEEAIRTLPGEISLGFSPYAFRPGKLVEAARTAGHEFLISIPMEPQGYPLTGAVESDAANVADIIRELMSSRVSERQGRVIDADQSASMERKKREGYF